MVLVKSCRLGAAARCNSLPKVFTLCLAAARCRQALACMACAHIRVTRCLDCLFATISDISDISDAALWASADFTTSCGYTGQRAPEQCLRFDQAIAHVGAQHQKDFLLGMRTVQAQPMPHCLGERNTVLLCIWSVKSRRRSSRAIASRGCTIVSCDANATASYGADKAADRSAMLAVSGGTTSSLPSSAVFVNAGRAQEARFISASASSCCWISAAMASFCVALDHIPIFVRIWI